MGARPGRKESAVMTISETRGLALEPIADVDPVLWEAMQGERRRQHDNIELIASENYVSAAVMEAQGSWLTNKYAEGLPGKRYYGGCEFVDVAERLAQEPPSPSTRGPSTGPVSPGSSSSTCACRRRRATTARPTSATSRPGGRDRPAAALGVDRRQQVDRAGRVDQGRRAGAAAGPTCASCRTPSSCARARRSTTSCTPTGS